MARGFRGYNNRPFASMVTLVVLVIIMLIISNFTKTRDIFKISDDATVDDFVAYFIDVGQGDAFLAQSDGETLLIDAGTNESTPRLLKFLSDLGVQRIDTVIGTHPHEDHIGGLDKVIEAHDIGKIYMTDATTTTKTFKDVLTEISKKGLKITKPTLFSTTTVGGITITFLSPESTKYENMNDNSIIALLEYKGKKILMTGDAEREAEKDMLGRGGVPMVDVLKVGHHGSNSSTTADFLTAISPKIAVISCGKDNTYGHPHEQIIERLQLQGVEIYSTAEGGTIKMEYKNGGFSLSQQ